VRLSSPEHGWHWSCSSRTGTVPPASWPGAATITMAMPGRRPDHLGDNDGMASDQSDLPGHVFQADGVAEVLTDHRHNVLLAAIGSSDTFDAQSRWALPACGRARRLAPLVLVTAERPTHYETVSCVACRAEIESSFQVRSSTRRTSRLRNVGGGSQSLPSFPANSDVSDSLELSIASS
jgi:hypothetical protein